jgi:hypothetical protein
MALDAGEAGKPDATKEDGKLRIKDRGEQKQMTKEEAIAYAESAGIMGSARRISAGIKSVTGEADFSSGFDGSDVYGPLFGAEGEGRGSFGFARDGVGFGGGCGYHDCGIVGTGRYKTIGDGDGPGRGGWGIGGPGNGRWRKREGATPTVSIPAPREVSDGLDKAIIKRYVKRNLAKIEYCYETELLVKPNLEGTVSVQFLITSTGTVSSAVGAGMDANVAKCVAGVVKNIEFPAPKSGGNVQVNYPFTFRGAAR